MSKQLLPTGEGTENAVAWARHQLVVTRHKDQEQMSSSPYAMWDSLSPVTNFSHFYEVDEDIVDQDLIFWISLGMHGIPHSEALPAAPTTDTKLSFSLSPYNFYPECPSMSSRDALRVEHKLKRNPAVGVTLRTYSGRSGTCSLVESNLKGQLKDNPDVALDTSRKTSMLWDI